MKTEQEIKEALTEMPQKYWDVVNFVIEDEIYKLESYLAPALSKDHGVLSSYSGGIYALRALTLTLSENRLLKE